MEGNYTEAMSQQATVGQPLGHTPLHILCSGSDVGLVKIEVMRELIENNIVHPAAFATFRNIQVAVLFIFGKSGHAVILFV